MSQIDFLIQSRQASLLKRQNNRLNSKDRFSISCLLQKNKKQIQLFTSYKQVVEFVKQDSGALITEHNAKSLLRDVGVSLKNASRALRVKNDIAKPDFYERNRKDIRTLARQIILIHKLLNINKEDFDNGNEQKNFIATLKIAEAVSNTAFNMINKCDGKGVQHD